MDRSDEIIAKLDVILGRLEGLKPIFEANDKRLAIIEDSVGAVARDAAQARHNTHVLNNKLQTHFVAINANLEVLAKHFSDIEIPVHDTEGA